MNSHFAELCGILHEAGVHVTVLTTGLLLPRFADTLVSLTGEVIVSLDGPPEVHNRIRRVSGAFELLSTGVKALIDTNPETRIATPIVTNLLVHPELCPSRLVITIQLELACEIPSLVDAWKHDRPAGTMWVLTTPYNGQTCFRVLWGRYPTREAARRALSGVPRFFSTPRNHPVVTAIR